MSRNLQKIILIASLTFNVAVLALLGFTVISGRNPFFGPSHRRHPDERLLANKEMRPFMEKMEKHIRDTRPLEEQSRKALDAFMGTLREANFQQAKVDSALTILLASRAKIEEKMGKDMIDMRKSMSSTQAKAFFTRRITGDGPPPHGRRARGRGQGRPQDYGPEDRGPRPRPDDDHR